MHEAESFMKS